ESQGSLVDCTRERLGVNDHVLTAMRAVLLSNIAAVERGEDPKHILRQVVSRPVVRVAGRRTGREPFSKEWHRSAVCTL
ncbi:MAG TPA: hypothetical protein VGK54_18145, partial [Chloroflexota bacterium]